MDGLAVGTVAAKPFLPFARVLAESFRRSHPTVPFFVLLADEVEGCFDPAAEPYHLVRLSDLAVPDLPRFCFHYSQQELSYAATPYLLTHLLDRGFRRAVFLKQESLVLDDLAPAFDLLNSASILLTPHLLAPLTGALRIARELNILQAGVYNVGFLGVADTPVARRFLAWWRDRLFQHCRHDISRGMHYEQRWLDLAPGLFDGCRVLRDPGVNVGHWNLPERDVRVDGDAVTACGRQCRFVRFSGFDPDVAPAVTRYNPRVTLDAVGPAAELFRRYAALLEAAGFRAAKHWPYSYGRFDNGVPVPELARQLYRELGDDAARFGDPLSVEAPESFYRWLSDPPIPRLWRAVYDRRPDVRAAFPDALDADRTAFLNWAAENGVHEYGVSTAFVPDHERAAA